MHQGVNGFIRTSSLLGLAGVCVLAGCGGSSGTSRAKGGQLLSPADFAGLATQPPSGLVLASDAAARGEATEAPVAQPPRITSLAAASEDIADVTALPGPAPQQQPRVTAQVIDGPVLVDAKIGDINGKPVYASKFLETRASKLRELARDLHRSQPRAWRTTWRTEARKDFEAGLNSLIEDELLRAEAVASFSPQQREGFFAWIQGMSDKLASENRGSTTAAARNLKNQSLQEYLREKELEELVKFQLSKHVHKRVNVSWRDISQWYDTHYADYNPPPVARFRLVQVATRNTQDVDAFVAALASGKPFAELAAMPINSNNAKEGGVLDRPLTADRTTMTFFNHEDLNRAAQTIEPGQTAGPMQVGDYTAWLHLEAIVSNARTLHQEQLRIENGLKALKTRAELEKYIARLRSKATVTSVQEMTARLLAIAEERYLPREN